MDKNYRALELDKILEMVAGEASCPDGAELARAIQPVYTAAAYPAHSGANIRQDERKWRIR